MRPEIAKACELLELARGVSVKLNTYGLQERLRETGYIPVEVREMSESTVQFDRAIETLRSLEGEAK